MIKQLQKKFIRIALVSLTVAMVLVVTIVNVANWISVRGELYHTLSLVAPPEELGPEGLSDGTGAGTPPPLPEEAGGDAPEADSEETQEQRQSGFRRERGWRNNGHFVNMVAEANWFAGVFSAGGDISTLRTDRMENLEEEDARALLTQAAESGKESGFLQDYLYTVRTLRDGRKVVTLLNCETRLTTMRTLILISILACAGGVLLAWLLVTLASRKAVEPTIRTMEQQKQFITNASHELKTPLTVISTNMELMQMEAEDNPWVKSTQKQTAVMRKLVDELVYLSRMEEEHPPLEWEMLDAGKLLEETAEPFAAMAEYKGLEMRVSTEGDLQMNGDRASLQRLMSTLCDNAVKYADGSPILAEARQEGKSHVLLRLSNPVAEPLTKEQCEQLFQRFYRADPSRNKEKRGGFGIGLAIAAAVAEKHGGRITAAMEDSRLVFSCLLSKKASGE